MKLKFHLLTIVAILFLFQEGNSQGEQVYLIQAGKIDIVKSQILNESKEIYVQIPSDYDPNSDRKYPVVYILDGDVMLPALINVHEFYFGGFMPEMILVGIANKENRTRDLTIPLINTAERMPPNYEHGEADQFLKFIAEELIPYVESNYPVTSFRTLIGHSYGGQFTINALLKNPALFTNYLAIDPSLDWDDQRMLSMGRDSLLNQDYTGKSLFVSLSGQLHMQDPTVTIDNVRGDQSFFTLFSRSILSFMDMVKEVEENGLRHEWKFYPRDLHGTVPLPSIMDGMISLFQWYQMEHTDKINSPETPTDELVEIINSRSEKLKKNFQYEEVPYPEDLLNVLGYMSMDMEQIEKAKMYFEFAIKFYPKSANAYDSMSDFCMSQNDTENAFKFATKAYELSGSDYHKEKIESIKKK
ncbi:MAG: alpha/beta hydrolase [Saprospiraceae bacterium]|nr:alpha/beta hydrolase [Saprospiraceae bacterium]